MRKYDYLIVGAGLFGAVFAHEATKCGKTCLVIDKREHIGGNIYTEETEGIQVHKYGAYIFHTSRKEVWEYVNQFAEFNHFVNAPIAVYKDELYNLPFNMNTFHALWGVKTPAQAKAKIQEQIARMNIVHPKTWKSRHWLWWDRMFTRNWWKAIPGNNGDGSAKTCLLLLSRGCLCVIPMIIITLRILIRNPQRRLYQDY